MKHHSLRDHFLTRWTLSVRSRQVFQKFLLQPESETFDPTQPITLQFLERYHCFLFPQQTAFNPVPDTNIFSLKVRATELILRQVNLYYSPDRLESLLKHCDPFTAVATFLKAVNFSYETLIQNQAKRQLCQDIFKEFMTVDQAYPIETRVINEFPLYESAAEHDFPSFQKTVFVFKRALDIIDILERLQPRNYQKQQHRVGLFWHQQSLAELEKLIDKLSS